MKILMIPVPSMKIANALPAQIIPVLMSDIFSKRRDAGNGLLFWHNRYFYNDLMEKIEKRLTVIFMRAFITNIKIYR